MKKFVAGAALAALTAVASPAFAQDASGIETYAGVLAGYDNVRVSSPSGSDNKGGFVYGGVLGAQTGIGSSALVGVEGEVTGATTKQSERNFLVAGDRAQLKAGRDFFIGARLGFRATPDLLVYAKGGYTNARATLTYTSAAGATTKDSDNLDGYRIGAGVEFGQGALRFRGEYRYSDYGQYKLNGVNTGVDAKRHQVVVGAIYAF